MAKKPLSALAEFKKAAQPLAEFKATFEPLIALQKKYQSVLGYVGVEQPRQKKQSKYVSDCEIPSPQSKPKQQRQAILNAINGNGWQPLALPSGSKTHLKHWYMKTFFKSEGAFNDRWKELRKQGLIRFESES